MIKFGYVIRNINTGERIRIYNDYFDRFVLYLFKTEIEANRFLIKYTNLLKLDIGDYSIDKFINLKE